MKTSMILVATVCCFGLMGGVLGVNAVEQKALAPEQKAPALEQKAAVTQSVFVCPHCQTLAMKAGKCAACEKQMMEKHVLGVKDGKAMLCACGAACPCDAAGMKDGKCACGKEVATMSVKGMYVCPDGCPMIADKAGKCACGKDLKKAE